MNGRLIELIMRLCFELIPDSTIRPFTRYRIGFMPLSERFRMKTQKQYKAYLVNKRTIRYEVETVSFNQKANPIRSEMKMASSKRGPILQKGKFLLFSETWKPKMMISTIRIR